MWHPALIVYSRWMSSCGFATAFIRCRVPSSSDINVDSMMCRSYHSQIGALIYLNVLCVYALNGTFVIANFSLNAVFTFTLPFYNVSHSLEHVLASSKKTRRDSMYQVYKYEMTIWETDGAPMQYEIQRSNHYTLFYCTINKYQTRKVIWLKSVCSSIVLLCLIWRNLYQISIRGQH